MGFSKLALALAILSAIYVSTAHLAQAQNAPSDYLRPHNAARRAVCVRPIKWNRTIAQTAQRYATQRVRDCRNVPPPIRRYGWNIYIGTPGKDTPSAAVASWVSEKPFYRCPSNTCAPGKTCSHYTQVVWSTSTQLGCARKRCINGRYFIICGYHRRGNVPGQRPYPCKCKEAMEAAEGAMEDLVEVAAEVAVEETMEEAVEEAMEMAEEEDVDEVEDVVAQVV